MIYEEDAARKLLADEEDQKINFDLPLKVQGTDGVRGIINFNVADPLLSFCSSGQISPAFAEIYCFVWGRLLLEDVGASSSRTIILAQDPRDQTNSFLNAASAGLAAAGLDLKYIGCLPTPFVPYAILQSKALGGVMLTASHNPKEQHGIKLFNSQGLKYLPPFDFRFTELLGIVGHNFSYTKDKEPQNIETPTAQAALIESYCSILDAAFLTIQTSALKEYDLVFDCANGAAAEVISRFIKKINCHACHVLNVNPSSGINFHSGVSEFEGIDAITYEEFISNSYWQKNQCLIKIFELVNSTKNILAFVFDGDADRMLALKYDYNAKKVIVLDGDAIATIFMQSSVGVGPKFLINTIESDWEVDALAHKFQYTQSKMAVGDKWIVNLANTILSRDSAAEVLGYEESGHFVLPLNHNSFNAQALLTGSGFLTAAKLLQTDPANYRQFERGFKFTYQIYYVDKSLLQNKQFRSELTLSIDKIVKDYPELNYQFKNFEFEEDLYYLEFSLKNKMIGSLYLRNSGTENKASINLRAGKNQSEVLSNIARKIYLHIWHRLKDKNASENIIMQKILKNPQSLPMLRKKYPKKIETLIEILERKELLLTKEALNALGKEVVNFFD